MSPVPSFRALALVVLLGAAAAAGAHEHSTYIEDLEDSLVAYAASDFAHGPPPAGLRHVDLRYRETAIGARSYMLCGQVRIGTGSQADWTDFATIKTDPYEQWLGGSATDMCARAIAVPPNGRDLSVALQRALADNASPSSTP